MKFWEEHAALRVCLIAAFFASGLFLVIFGWKMTGQLGGLGLMLVGLALLLGALYLYNKPFSDKKRKKK